MNPVNVAFLLFGVVLGALLVFVLTGLAVWFLDVSRAVREGTQLEGEGIERAKKRGDL